MKINYDPKADALYITLSNKEVKESDDYKEAKEGAEDKRKEVRNNDDYKEAKKNAKDKRREIRRR